MGTIEVYLLIINALGFLVSLVNGSLGKRKGEGRKDILPAVVSILGGALGTSISLLIFNRRAEKSNMLSRVMIASLTVVDILSFLIYKGFLGSEVTFAFWNILLRYPLSLIYLALINIVTFFVFLWDKKAAEKGKDRVKIVTLLSLSFFGGSLGALGAMYLFRHKTNRIYFTLGVPVMVVTQIFVLFFLSNMAF